MEVTASRQLTTSSRTVSAPPDPFSSALTRLGKRSPSALRRQAAVDDQDFVVFPEMDRRKSSADQQVAKGYFKRSSPTARRRESEDIIARKTSVDNTGTGSRKTSIVEPMMTAPGGARRKSSADTSVSMYFKRSPTQTRRNSKNDDANGNGNGRKTSVDVSRRMSIEPNSDRRKGSAETSVSGYFRRSPIQARRESDDILTRKSSVDNSRKTSVDTACTVIYRPATIKEDTNVAVKDQNGEIREHEADLAETTNEKEAGARGGARGEFMIAFSNQSILRTCPEFGKG